MHSSAPGTSPADSRRDGQLDRWRADTPGAAERVHLNNAGAALQPRPVLKAVERHLRLEARLGGYEAADAAREDVGRAYAAVAALIGATDRNVAIVENATVAFAQALSAFDFRSGDRLVTSRADYPSHQLMYLSLARRLGVEVVRAADLPDGGVDPESVRALAQHPRTRLVALTWVPTNSGLMQDAHAVGVVCAELGVPYVVDACQSVGQMPVDVQRLRCDFLAGTGRKFLRGPRGIGFLYVSDAALARGDAPLYIDMRGADRTAAGELRVQDSAQRFENWEFAYALVLGLGAAARYALAVGLPGFDRARALAAGLRDRLARVRGLELLDREQHGRERGAIVTLAVPGYDAGMLMRRLRERGINTSVSFRAAGAADVGDAGAGPVLRLSPHYYNTPGELDTAAEALAALTRGG